MFKLIKEKFLLCDNFFLLLFIYNESISLYPLHNKRILVNDINNTTLTRHNNNNNNNNKKNIIIMELSAIRDK